MKRVVITGMGTVNPLGNNVKDFWNNIVENKLGFSYIDQFDTTDFDVKVAGSVKGFDPLERLDKKEAKRMERFTQFAVSSTLEALDDCGSDLKDLDPFRVGVIIGCGIGGIEATLREHNKMNEKGSNRISALYIPTMIPNMAAGQISITTGFKGDNFCTVTACSSGTHAIGESFRKIKDGYLDACVCGGTESCINEFDIAAFNNMKALSRSTELDDASIPFDLNRHGFVLGEGCGILILEELEHAKARNAQIYAEVVGYGATCDGYHITSPSPEGDAAAVAMKNAYTEAGFEAKDVDYINAHGTSTGLNDKYETRAIKIALGEEAAHNVLINSTKSMTGHLLGAAGGVEAVVTALELKNGLVHKTVGYKTPDPLCDLNYCTDGNVKKDIKVALSNSLGFGGHNATLCIKRYEN